MESSGNVRSMMRVSRSIAVMVLVASLGMECSSSNTAQRIDGGSDVPQGLGGEPVMGGVPGAGGTHALGGGPGAGGLTTTGGRGQGGGSGSGGLPGLGGIAGSASGRGGATGTGGSPATGGIPGAGGIPGTGGKNNTGGATAIDAAGDGSTPKMGTPCRSQSDCGASSTMLYCRAPGEPLGCGMCRTGADGCASDGDCAPDGGGAGVRKICETAPSSSCYCKPTKLCIAGCRSKADCAAGEGCNANHACQATCAGNGDCEADYACSSAGFCERKACTSDTECSAACVKNACYGALGSCQAPAA